MLKRAILPDPVTESAAEDGIHGCNVGGTSLGIHQESCAGIFLEQYVNRMKVNS